MNKAHRKAWEAIQQLAEPNLEPGEQLVAVAFVSGLAVRPEMFFGAVGVLIGHLIRQRKKADSPPQEDTGFPALALGGGLGLTNRRLLVWSGTKERAFIGAVAVADIEMMRSETPKFTRSPLDGRLVLKRRGFDSVDVPMLKERAASMEQQFAVLASPIS